MGEDTETLDDSGSSNTGSGAGSEVDESDTSGRDHHHGFFDIEASESNEPDESGSEQAEFDTDIHHSFPHFCRIPVELRWRIWEFFCPDLAAQPRVFNFMAMPATTGNGADEVWPDATISSQTAAARAMLATHRESRSLALGAFPDTLEFLNGGPMIRFNSADDVIRLEIHGTPSPRYGHIRLNAGFRNAVRHLAICPNPFNAGGDIEGDVLEQLNFVRFLLTFPHLKTIYSYANDYSHRREHLKWCVSDSIYRYYCQTFEIEPGLGEDLQFMYCWPDLIQNSDYAWSEIPMRNLGVSSSDLSRVAVMLGDLHASDEDIEPLNQGEVDWLSGIKVCPMVGFEFDSGLHNFNSLLDRKAADNWNFDSDSSSESEDSTDSDQYESDGIDDAEIDGDREYSSDEEGDLEVIPLSDEESTTLEGLDLPQDEAGDDDPVALFSSPEPEPESSSSDESGALGTTATQATIRMAKRPNRRIVSSDSEGDSDEDIQARPVNRRPRVILSDSEDEDEDAGGGKGPAANPIRPETGQDDSSEKEESDEEGDKSRPMSLAERLQLHRQENPISSPGSHDGSDTEASGGDYDTRNYNDFENDEGDDEGLGYSSGDADDQSAPAMTVGTDEDSEEEGGW